MRSKMIFGALLVSVALCSQGFGFELLDRMLGLNGGGCCECNACAKVAPCCQPCCAKPCAPACCEKPCCAPTCERCKVCRPTPVRDLFCNIKDLFGAKSCYTEPCCEAKCCAPKCCCEPKCCAEPCCAPKCCHKVRCCEKPCCAPPCCEKPCCAPKCCCEKACCAPPCCEKVCKPKCHKLYRRPVLELLENMFGPCGNECGCSEGCCECGCGGVPAVPGKTTVPSTGPAKAPESTTPPPPAGPKADTVTTNQPRGIYQQASRSLARN